MRAGSHGEAMLTPKKKAPSEVSNVTPEKLKVPSADKGVDKVAAWKSRFLYADEKTPWVALEVSDKNIIVYCSACRRTLQVTPLARGKCFDDVDTKLLSRHQKSFAHACAMSTAASYEKAPSLEDFESVYKELLDGKSFNKVSPNIARSRTKAIKIGWCLKEAILGELRDTMRRAECIAIHQDGAGKHHAIMYTAVDSALEVTRDTLGVERDVGGTSEKIAEAMTNVVLRFCTKHDTTVPGVKAKQRVDLDLAALIFEKTEIFDADGASNEQLAGILAAKGMFVNLKERVKDKTHASRRISGKAWSSDPRIWEVFDFLVSSSNSVTRLVENSDDIKSIFNKYAQQSHHNIEGKHVRSMMFSKERFDSTSKPAARLILWFEALVATCIEVSTTRTSAPQARANDFLEWITESRLLTMALIADASDESLGVTRFLDADSYDVAEAPTYLDNFMRRLHAMFIDAGCWKVGYAKFVLDLLKREFVLPVKNKVRGIGGGGSVTPEMQD